jgi:hypothetical protein
MKSHLTILLFALLILNLMFGQDSIKCHFPIHVPADSLINILIKDADSPNDYKNTTYVSGCKYCPESKKKFDEKMKIINFDSLLWKCQDYLIQRIGSAFYCKYVDMDMTSFDNKINFGVQLPNIEQNENRGGKKYQYERMNIDFTIRRNKDGSFKEVVYPTNIPVCNGLPDCGFVYTREKALEVVKSTGFLKEGSGYYIRPDGIDWEITLPEDKHGGTYSVKVNMQTGKQSAIQRGQRID